MTAQLGTSRTRIRKERRLPLPGEVLVSQGDRVDPGTIVARTELVPGAPWVLDLAKELRAPIDPDTVDRVMLKSVGDTVKAQEPIAKMSVGFFGETSVCKSPVDGVIEFISRVQGRVLIREEAKTAEPLVFVNAAKDLDVWPRMLPNYLTVRVGDQVKMGQVLGAAPTVGGMDYCYTPAAGTVEDINFKTGIITILRPSKTTKVEAYISGVVTEVIERQGVIIESDGTVLHGAFGFGREAYGRLRLAVPGPDAELRPEDIRKEDEGAVLAGGAYAGREALRRAVEIGVRGLIVGGVDHIDLVSLLGREVSVTLTGGEDIPLTLVVTEGLGSMGMSAANWQALARAEGMVVSLNGATQVRAGAVRPEVILPIPVGDRPQADAHVASGQRLQPGMRVRCVRRPYMGVTGTVRELPAEPVRRETGCLALVAVVETDAGNVMTVPQANLEAVEG